MNNSSCVIVGAGVAGCAVAWLLARRGYKVTLLEKTRAAHHKVCGEFLSGEALGDLNEMGVTVDDHPAIRRLRLFGENSQAVFDLPQPGRGVARIDLDEMMIQRCSQAGVNVQRGICVTSILQHGQISRLETSCGPFEGRHVFLATGKHDLCGLSKRKGRDETLLGFKCHLSLPTELKDVNDAIALFSFRGGYGGVSPVKGGRFNLCFVMSKALHKKLGARVEKTMEAIGRSNPHLGRWLKAAKITTPVCAVGFIPYGFIRPHASGTRLFLVGDQQMVIPSLVGDGLACALKTARDAVDLFEARLKRSKICLPSMKPLKRQMRWAFLGHRILKSPGLTDALIPWVRRHPGVIRFLFEKTRVSF